MQVLKVSLQNYSHSFNGGSKLKKDVISHLIDYNPNNITENEYREFVHYLATNKINKTFVEPKKFITEAERQKLQDFRDMVHYLAENEINRIFIC